MSSASSAVGCKTRRRGSRIDPLSGYHPAALVAWDDLRRAGLFARPAVLRALAVRYVSGGLRDAGDTAHFIPVPGAAGEEPVW